MSQVAVLPVAQSTDISSVLDKRAAPTRPISAQTLQAIDMWDDFLKRAPAALKLPSFPIWSMEFRETYPYKDATPPAIWKELGPRDLDHALGSFGFELKGLKQSEQFELLPSHARRPTDLKFLSWKQTFIRQNRQFYWANLKWIDPWLDKWKPWKLSSSLQKFEWNVQGGGRRIDEYVLQVRASDLRVKRTSTAPSLIAMTHTQVPILGKDIVGVRRYMTPAECAALQSLGSISLPDGDLRAYKALGNAVNADVLRAIAEPLLRGLHQTSVVSEDDQHTAA